MPSKLEDAFESQTVLSQSEVPEAPTIAHESTTWMDNLGDANASLDQSATNIAGKNSLGFKAQDEVVEDVTIFVEPEELDVGHVATTEEGLLSSAGENIDMLDMSTLNQWTSLLWRCCQCGKNDNQPALVMCSRC